MVTNSINKQNLIKNIITLHLLVARRAIDKNYGYFLSLFPSE